MNILHVIPSLTIEDGGPTQAVLAMEKALALQGIAIDIATTTAGARERESVMPRRLEFARQFNFYKVAAGFAWWMSRKVRCYDVVHIHALFSFMSTVAALLSCMAGVPYIVRPLGTVNHYGVQHRRSWLKRLSIRCIEAPILRRAAAVHFTSDAERVEAAALSIDMRSVVLPLGIEPFRPVGPAALTAAFPQLVDRQFVLFMSRLDKKKNIEALLQAFAAIRCDVGDPCLVIAGSGDRSYAASLQALAEKLGLRESVLWVGFVSGAPKAALLEGANAFVLPSFSENFGIAAAEALMAGLPCILGRGVALTADVEAAGAGIGVSPDAGSIECALKTVLADAGLRMRMRLAARKLAEERYSLEAMGKSLAALYQHLQIDRRSDW